MTAITIRLAASPTDNYPHPHPVGEGHTSPVIHIEGIVRNAEYAGTKKGDAAWINNPMEIDNAKIMQRPSADL